MNFRGGSEEQTGNWKSECVEGVSVQAAAGNRKQINHIGFVL